MLNYFVLLAERSILSSLFSAFFSFIKRRCLVIQNNEIISIINFHNSGPNIILKTQWKTDCFSYVRMCYCFPWKKFFFTTRIFQEFVFALIMHSHLLVKLNQILYWIWKTRLSSYIEIKWKHYFLICWNTSAQPQFQAPHRTFNKQFP